MSKFLFSFSIIAFGLWFGYFIQILSRKRKVTFPIGVDRLRKLLQKLALLFFMPVTVLGAIWIVNIKAARIALLPFIGFFAIFLGGVLAIVASRLLRLEPRKTGALFACGSFTNIGSIGSLICYVFLGEVGFALVPIYKLFEEITYYSIGFPITKLYSAGGSKGDSHLSRIKGLVTDPFIIAIVSSMAIGAVLNVTGVERPQFYRTVNSVCIPLGTVLLLTSIGLAMRFRSVKEYLRECITVSIIKFVLIPVSVTWLAFLIGFGNIDDGLPLKVVMILSSMPVAFIALIPASIYDLDLDLANSCWFFTTSLLVIVLPGLQYALKIF